MWYSKDAEKPELDFNKPITAERNGEHYLLLPCPAQRIYAINGYNWFRLKDGAWNSCSIWKTPELAIKAYSGYNIRNVTIKIMT